MFWLFLACSEKEVDSAQLPPEEVTEEQGFEPSFEADPVTDSVAFDEQPMQMLQLQHSGIWNLAPIAGPYTSMYGELNIQELIDGYTVVPYCDFSFAVTGYATEDVCPTCDFAFSIEFFVMEPEPSEEEEEEFELPEDFPQAEDMSDCFSPELPDHQEIRVMSYSLEDEMIYFNYFDTGIWIPWYPATFIHDTLEIYYLEEIGFFGAGDD